MSTQPGPPKTNKKLAAPPRAALVRYYNPAYLHEITIRTNRGAFGFDPNCQELNSKIVGLLYMAAVIYGIKVIAIHFMSNHYHGLFDIPSSANFSKFLMHFHGSLARLSHEHLGRDGKFWSENKWVAVAQDEASVSRRIRYILGQAVKAGLVEHPIQFPGVSCAKAMIDGKSMRGIVIDRTRRYRDVQLKAGAAPLEAYTREVVFDISPPRCWTELSPGELQSRYRAIADEAAATPLHVLRETPLLAEPELASGPQVLGVDPTSADGQAVPAEATCARLQDDLTLRYMVEFAEVFGDSREESVQIPPRQSESREPFEQGPPKAKQRGDKRKRLPYLLSANLREVLEYEAAYLAICEAYAAAKRHWHKRAKSGGAGLSGPKLCLPQYTLVGSMPLVD